jgi:hypothetical protein
MKRLAAIAMFQHGLSVADSEGYKARLATLTDGSRGELDLPALYSAWGKLTKRLERRGLLGEYALAVETTPKRGFLHVHAILTDGKRGGGYIPHRLLSEQAQASGFGKVVDIRAITDIPQRSDLASYLTKSGMLTREAVLLGSYLTKQGAAQTLQAKTIKRVRPFRVSRGWAIGIREAEKQLAEAMYGDQDKDPGPFERWTEQELMPELCRQRVYVEDLEEARRLRVLAQASPDDLDQALLAA